MKNRPARTIGKISSLEDLRLEKARLQMDILKKENQIHSDYQQILNKLTLRHLFRTIREDVAITSNVTSKLISFGKKILARKKKKKKIHGVKPNPSLPQEPLSHPEETTGE
jgi:hypothetical protein